MAIRLYWGNLLRDLRIENNLTQSEVAEVLHISRQAYSNLETGRVQPTIELMAILCELYDYDIYNYVLQNMPDDMVAEQYRFKTQLPLKASKKKKKD